VAGGDTHSLSFTSARPQGRFGSQNLELNRDLCGLSKEVPCFSTFWETDTTPWCSRRSWIQQHMVLYFTRS